MLDGLRARLRPHLAPLPNFEERERASQAKRLDALEQLLGLAWCEECGTYHEADYKEPWPAHVGARGQGQANDPYPPVP